MSNIAVKEKQAKTQARDNKGFGGDRKGGAGRKPQRPKKERTKPDYEQKILNIRRVTRVMKGGRRFSFSVVLVIGNRKGLVGIGVGKANDTSLAIQKAYRDAEKNLIKLTLGENNSIAFESEAKYSTARVMIMPNAGRGLVAGSAMRIVLELAGVTDVTGRILSRSKNQLNIARATVETLSPFSVVYKKTTPAKKEQNKEASISSNQEEN